MNRRRFCKIAGLGSAMLMLPSIFSTCTQKKQKPNFVLVLADDMGWSDLSLHGNRILETPHLDNLAKQSAQFTNFNVNSVCAPSRASLLTGRHFLRTGVSHVHGGKEYIALNETLLPEILQEKGYATGLWGKWHSGQTDGYLPWQRGFDEAYKAKLYQHRNSEGLLNGKPVQHQKWGSEVIVDYTLDFMKRNRNQPFFAYLPLMNCHEPLDAPKNYVEKYKAKGLSRNFATLYGMVDFMDSQIHRLMTSMEQMGLLENTVVMFLSDNGPAVINRWLTDEERDQRYVNNLKGHKGNIWENGVKSPFFVYWKGQIEPVTINRLVDICDIFPTIVELAGIDKHDNFKSLDGRSIQSYLFGNTTCLPPKITYNYAGPGWPPTDKPWTPQGVHDEYRPIPPEKKQEWLKFDDQIISVQKENYKLLKNPGTVNAELVDGYALFDMDKDLQQNHNLITEKPEIAGELKQLLKTWWQSIPEEKNSFRMPVFQIGGKQISRVLAYGAQRQSDTVKTAFNYSYNWTQPGDFAEYKINVLNAGKYEVLIKHESKQPSNAIMQLKTGNKSQPFKVNKNDIIKIGEINLNKGAQTLRLELDKLAGDRSAFDQLIEFQFVKIK
ncbi:MAG: sulfatase-like hydrolase/transferase [Fidelibacterota bacterium]